MKRGWWLLVGFLIIVMTSSATAKTFNLSECWGATLCGDQYSCGVQDGICLDDLFAVGSEPDADGGCAKPFPAFGYSKCIDPDCVACINGTVTKAAPNPPDPIVGASIKYEQEVWNGSEGILITVTTITDAFGKYQLNVSAGNDIYLLTQADGFTPELKGPIFDLDPRITGACMELNISLRNGTCLGSCVRDGSIYCDASCQGEGTPGDLCQFNQSVSFERSDGLGSITIESPLATCSRIGTQIGSFVDLGNFTHNDTGIRTCIRVNCCEGNPVEVACPEAILAETLISGDTLDNAIKVTRIARYKGEPIKIRVYYWE